MKKAFITISILMLFVLTGYSQLLSPQDKLALEIPQQDTYSANRISSYVKTHFPSDSERVRALFVWVSNNISYDVEKLRSKNMQETTVNDVLRTRKAVCGGYSELLVALLKECNIRSVLVSGYTKLPNGSTADLPHAWVAAEVNSKWYLFDPTWAAGSVKDFQFARNFSNRYYKLTAEEMIKDHMPFDPMYQFLSYPLLYEDFNRGSAINTSKPFFNYADTIKHYNSLDTLNQFLSTSRRINRNGEKNQMVYEMVRILNKNQHIGDSRIGFDAAVAQFNKGTDLFNRYIGYKNARFSSIKEDKEIQQMIDSVLLHIKTAYSMLESVSTDHEEHRRALQNINSALTKFYYRVDEENMFLKTYLKTDRASRK